MSEVYLMFFHATFQLFVNFNQFLQREESLVPVLHDEMLLFMKRLFGKFLSISAIKEGLDDITSISYHETENQLPG